MVDVVIASGKLCVYLGFDVVFIVSGSSLSVLKFSPPLGYSWFHTFVISHGIKMTSQDLAAMSKRAPCGGKNMMFHTI